MPAVEITQKTPFEASILTPEALNFLVLLHQKFGKERLELLKRRQERQHYIDSGQYPQILPESHALRRDLSWSAAPIPKELERRWVEITGPTDKKTIINGLNSGADVFMADFEDGNSPTWHNMVEGQLHLKEAVAKTLRYTSSEGKEYKLNEKTAVLFTRPRGWHLVEKHLKIDKEAISASLFDFGLYFFHNAKNLMAQGSAPYFYLPKLENHLEAKLWNDIFIFAQDHLKIPLGTIRASVLVENILVVFEMEEILWELKSHSAGLNAGRWDYIFSIIKKFNRFPIVFPEREYITMQVPFLQAYTDLLVRTSHKRKIHAIGGMAPFSPSRKNPQINKVAFGEIFEEKEREARQGFDGTWVAHPDLVPLAKEPFQKKTGKRLNQILFPLPPVSIKPANILDFNIPGSIATDWGVATNIQIFLRYLAAWFSGVGALTYHYRVEDASTAEICRAQLWQWLRHPDAIKLRQGKFTKEAFDQFLKMEYSRAQGDPLFPERYKNNLSKAKSLLVRLVNEPNIPDFFTTAAYEELE